jgi:hypothetical protein
MAGARKKSLALATLPNACILQIWESTFSTVTRLWAGQPRKYLIIVGARKKSLALATLQNACMPSWCLCGQHYFFITDCDENVSQHRTNIIMR